MHFPRPRHGLVSHEAPRSRHRARYYACDASRPLEAGMVVSVETTLAMKRGSSKLEDTVVYRQGL